MTKQNLELISANSDKAPILLTQITAENARKLFGEVAKEIINPSVPNDKTYDILYLKKEGLDIRCIREKCENDLLVYPLCSLNRETILECNKY